MDGNSTSDISQPQENAPSVELQASSDQHLDRTELVTRARSFLSSLQIRNEDAFSKRKFLSEKGLTDAEIDQLLRESTPQVPSIPPRSYPQPLPSHLPNLLLGIIRISTWLAGGSAALLLVYYRYILPQLTQSYHARSTLKHHQKQLLSRLSSSLSSTKTTQTECFAGLPRSDPLKENPKYAACHALDAVLEASGDEKLNDVVDVTLLRCAIEELSKEESREEGVETGRLFDHLRSKLSLLQDEDGMRHQEKMWHTLNHSPSIFKSSMPSEPSVPAQPSQPLFWSCVPPLEPISSPALLSLSALPEKLRSHPVTSTSADSRRTLQSLSDFTGYITTQTYSMSLPGVSNYRSGGASSLAFGSSAMLGAEEEEIRREIRALKGLVLNRRSFLGGGVTRPLSAPSPATAAESTS